MKKCFIGITKGLIDYTSFIFRNFLRDNDFLTEELGSNTDQKPVIISHQDFSDWVLFCQSNGIADEPLDYTPNNYERKIVA